MRPESSYSQTRPSFTLALTASQFRLPCYRSTYRLRYHPYVGQRSTLYQNVTQVDDDELDGGYILPHTVAHHTTENILEPFVHGIQPTVEVAEGAQIHNNDHEEDVRPTSISDIVQALLHLLRGVRLSKNGERDAVDERGN